LATLLSAQVGWLGKMVLPQCSSSVI